MPTVNQSNSTIVVFTGVTETVNGDDDLINSDDNVTLTVDGFNNTINQSNGSVSISGTGAQFDVVSGTKLAIHILDASTLFFNGSETGIYATNAQVNAVGDNINLIGSDDRFVSTEANGGGAEIVGNNDRAIVGAQSQLLVYGDDDFVRSRYGGTGKVASLYVDGKDERLVGSGFFALADKPVDVFIGRNGQTGPQDTFTGSNSTLRTGADSNIILSGDDDTVAVREDNDLYFVGDGLAAHVGQGSVIAINGKGETTALDLLTGAHFTLNVSTASNVEISTLGVTANLVSNVALSVARSDNTINAGGSDTISILAGAASNEVLLGQNDVITDGGWNSTFEIAGNVGTATLKQFGADSAGIVDLLNGVGQYATAQDAYSHLTSDGAGGLSLSLGANGSIDFVGATSLSAANFKIG
jgi:hypothetical protein